MNDKSAKALIIEAGASLGFELTEKDIIKMDRSGGGYALFANPIVTYHNGSPVYNITMIAGAPQRLSPQAVCISPFDGKICGCVVSNNGSAMSLQSMYPELIVVMDSDLNLVEV